MMFIVYGVRFTIQRSRFKIDISGFRGWDFIGQSFEVLLVGFHRSELLGLGQGLLCCLGPPLQYPIQGLRVYIYSIDVIIMFIVYGVRFTIQGSTPNPEISILKEIQNGYFRVWGLEFGIWNFIGESFEVLLGHGGGLLCCLGPPLQYLGWGFGVQDQNQSFRVQGSGFGVQRLGVMVYGLRP